MGFEGFLSAEDKVTALTEMRRAMFTELYTLLIRAGIDPETVDYETWTLPSNEELMSTYITVAHFLHEVKRICESIKIVDSKIGKL